MKENIKNGRISVGHRLDTNDFNVGYFAGEKSIPETMKKTAL